MYFFITVALAALSLLVGAAPAQKPRHNTLSVSLSKRSTHRDANGAVAVGNLQAGTHHSTAFVLPFFYGEGWLFNKSV